MAPGITVCQVSSIEQARGVNELYLKRDMVPTDPEFIWAQRASDQIVWLVAIDNATDTVLGTVMGINHIALFDDPSRGSQLVVPGGGSPGAANRASANYCCAIWPTISGRRAAAIWT